MGNMIDDIWMGKTSDPLGADRVLSRDLDPVRRSPYRPAANRKAAMMRPDRRPRSITCSSVQLPPCISGGNHRSRIGEEIPRPGRQAGLHQEIQLRALAHINLYRRSATGSFRCALGDRWRDECRDVRAVYRDRAGADIAQGRRCDPRHLVQSQEPRSRPRIAQGWRMVPVPLFGENAAPGPFLIPSTPAVPISIPL